MVVDLSVADDHSGAVLVEHWLVASHQTDDGEAAHSDDDPVVLVPAHAVGTTMPHALQRRTDTVGTCWPRRRRGIRRSHTRRWLRCPGQLLRATASTLPLDLCSHAVVERCDRLPTDGRTSHHGLHRREPTTVVVTLVTERKPEPLLEGIEDLARAELPSCEM